MTAHICSQEKCPRRRPAKVRDNGIKVVWVCTCEGRTKDEFCLRCSGL